MPTVAATKDLCRGWTAINVYQAAVDAKPQEQVVLRSIAQNHDTDVIAITKDTGLNRHQVANALGN
jgi:hypothetical protein